MSLDVWGKVGGGHGGKGEGHAHGTHNAETEEGPEGIPKAGRGISKKGEI